MSEFVTTSRGDTVAHERHGHGPAVAFVAGADAHPTKDPVTTATARGLARRGWTTVVHDRLGRGANRVGGRVDLDRELAAVDALLRVTGGGVLAGLGAGGAVALAAAARGLPVDGLVLWEPPLEPPSHHHDVQEWAEGVDRCVRAGDLHSAVWHYLRHMPPRLRQQTPPAHRDVDLTSRAGAYVADAEAVAWASGAPLRELLAAVDVPVLVLVGEDASRGTQDAADLVARLPRAHAEALPRGEDGWDVEAAVERVDRFLAGTPRRRAGAGASPVAAS
ncbi:alpha/beta fold hydrolase [Kineococcus sp. SYSU DK004]|uniref:alpha/beta fold hydrolase n=1 Tax=Kineococcus sp. SYSU DK004 TaxID=3383125 RepID=UPI003D7D8F46